MRTTPALRTLTAALFTGGILAVPVGTAMAATPAGSGGSGGPVRGTVVSAGDLNLRQQPATDSPVVGRLAPGSQDRVECSVVGQTVHGNPHWYWLVGAHAWASAAYVDTGGRSVPSCTDPCPEWKDHGHDRHDGWNASGSASGTWSFTWDFTWDFG